MQVRAWWVMVGMGSAFLVGWGTGRGGVDVRAAPAEPQRVAVPSQPPGLPEASLPATPDPPRCGPAREAVRIEQQRLCDFRLAAAGCVESLPWPDQRDPEADRAAWEQRLEEVAATCPDLGEHVRWVDCSEYPCSLVSRASMTTLNRCGLAAPGTALTLESALEGEPFTWMSFVDDPATVDAVKQRQDVRFREAWSIAESLGPPGDDSD